MDPPPSERRHTPYFRPKIQRITSELKAKVEDRQNCPYRTARRELNYNLASFGGGKNGVGQSGSVWDSLFSFSDIYRDSLGGVPGCPGGLYLGLTY